MKIVKAEDVVRAAVMAACATIDEYLDDSSKQSNGPLGDELASKLHEIIDDALYEHFKSDYAPAFIKLETDNGEIL